MDMDDKSTPIESLNNKGDDSEVVNNILKKYNGLHEGGNELPPLNTNVTSMENKFENRNLNKEMYEHSSNNVAYNEHYKNEKKRVEKYNTNQDDDDDDQDEHYDDYEDDEYEMVEIPLWRRVLNEIRIPIFIFIFVIIFSNCSFDKMLCNKFPILGNQFNDCNTYGFLLKALLISVFSYLVIRFIRF
jgi:hypothetical protein